MSIDTIDFVCGLDRLNELLWEATGNALDWANGKCSLKRVQLNHLAHIYGMSRFPYMALERVHSARFLDNPVENKTAVFEVKAYKGFTRRQMDSVYNALVKLAKRIIEEEERA